MIRQRLFLVCAVLSLCAFSPSGPGPVASAVGAGKVSGVWELPLGPQNGYVDGDLYAPSTVPTSSASPAYHFTAVLKALPVPVTMMLAGTIQGTLDDGVGPGPDYLVSGSYAGLLSTVIGTGTFSAQIAQPAVSSPSGFIAGNFIDMPMSLSPVPGHFNGRWKISN